MRLHHASEAQAAFIKACRRGDDATLAAVLALEGELAVDVHAGCEDGFQRACEGGHVGCMAQLLALTGPRHVDVHALGERAFRWACSHGHLSAVDVLLGLDGDRTVDVNARGAWALWVACRFGHLPVAQRLLALDDGRAVDVHAHGEGALRGATDKKQGAILRLLLAGTGRHAPDPAVVRELGLEGARAGAVWAGAGLRGGRGVPVASRVSRRAAARAARAGK